LEAAYCQVDLLCRIGALHAEAQAAASEGIFRHIFLPGGQSVPVEACIFLPDEACGGLAELVGKVDLSVHYPVLRGFFVERLGISGSFTTEECLECLRMLRKRSEETDEATEEAAAEIQRLASAALGLLERVSREHDDGGELDQSFAQEPLIASCSPAREGRISIRWYCSGACMWHDVPSGVEAEKVSLEACYPKIRRFLLVTLGIIEVDIEEVSARLQQLAFAAELGGVDVEAALLAAYCQLQRFCCESDAGSGDASTTVTPGTRKELQEALASTASVVVPGKGAVGVHSCVFLEEGLAGVGELADKIDLRPIFPDLRGWFVERMGVSSSLTTDECLVVLRALRGRSDEGDWQLAVATYELLEKETCKVARVVDLSLVFAEEPLIFTPSSEAANSGGEGCWRKSNACMWHEAPSGVEVNNASLELTFPPDLQRFFVESLGVGALNSEEVAARLDTLFEQSDEVICFSEAYDNLQEAWQQRQQEGVQMHDPELLAILQQKLFVGPDHGFVNHSDCIWQESPDRSAAVQLMGRHNLHEIYGGLRRYFVDCVQTPLCLKVNECIEGLRKVKAALASKSSEFEVTKTRKVKPLAFYEELSWAVLKASAEDIAEAVKTFRKDALIQVPVKDSDEGKWVTAEQCLWKLPEEAPEGWLMNRVELSLYFKEDLKSLFTERLGIPFSVRFTKDEGDDNEEEVVAPSGQPFWLAYNSKGKKLVPRPRDPAPEPPEPATPSKERPEAAAASPDPPAQIKRGYTRHGNKWEPVDGEEREPANESDTSPKPPPPPAKQPEPGADADAETGTAAAAPDEADQDDDEDDGPPPPPGFMSQQNRPGGDAGQGLGGRSEDEDKRGGAHSAFVPPPPPPPPPDPAGQVRGIASDGRKERKQLLERLARSVMVMTSKDKIMNSVANRAKHRNEECLDCNPKHDLDRVACVEGLGGPMGGAPASVPVWVEREGRERALERVKAAERSGQLQKFAALVCSLAQLFSVSVREKVHIFEEDTQTVAFNGGALFFNLRYFVSECHADCWEDAICFWCISFSHELAHFESPVHDRQHGRAMEHAQRAVLPGLPQVLSSPWGVVDPRDRCQWVLRKETGDL